MISIYVNDSQLVLGRNTTLTVEFNNALFANPDVDGDISFSFSLPVEGNERLLGFPNMPQCGGARKLPCTVYCNGNFSWNGQLVVQKASFNTLSAALVINPYPDGFGKRMMTENEDNEIEISDSLSAHDTAWAQFLAASIHNQDVKFAPFFNADGYGSDNDNWGFWKGSMRRKVVNELFFDGGGNLIDSVRNPFSKANNSHFDLQKYDGKDEETGEMRYSKYTEHNQLAFCPQIRIAKVFEIWCRNAGYSLVNHLGEDLNKTFMQSQRSLDGTKAQYVNDEEVIIETQAKTYVTNGFHWCESYYLNGQSQDCYVHDGEVWLPVTGTWELSVEGIFDPDMKEEIQSPNDYAKLKKVMLYAYDGTGQVNIDDIVAGIENVLYVNEIEKTGSFSIEKKIVVNHTFTDEGIRFLLCCNVEYHCFEQNYMTGELVEQILTKWQKVENVRMKIVFRLLGADTVQRGLNIFRRRFRIVETLPEVTNAAFLKAMMETMGLCYFVSNKTKRVEIVPFAMLRNAGSLDLTNWELTRETDLQTPEETLQTFRLKPLKDENYNEDLRLTDMGGNDLPDPYTKHKHLVLLTKTNTLYRAETEEDEEENWIEKWEEYSGNPDKLETGNGEEQNCEPGVSIPHQRFTGTSENDDFLTGIQVIGEAMLNMFLMAGHPMEMAEIIRKVWEKMITNNSDPQNNEHDTATNELPQFMVADFVISSDIYNPGEKNSDIILTQYRGLRKREYFMNENGGYVWNEVMLPVWNGEFSLTAKGENSLGEKYVKPVLELANHKTITYKLRLPVNMMQPVEDLLRPSDLPPERQTRFIVIRNVKTVPKKITFQIDNDRDDTVLCQIEAVKVY